MLFARSSLNFCCRSNSSATWRSKLLRHSSSSSAFCTRSRYNVRSILWQLVSSRSYSFLKTPSDMCSVGRTTCNGSKVLVCLRMFNLKPQMNTCFKCMYTFIAFAKCLPRLSAPAVRRIKGKTGTKRYLIAYLYLHGQPRLAIWARLWHCVRFPLPYFF